MGHREAAVAGRLRDHPRHLGACAPPHPCTRTALTWPLQVPALGIFEKSMEMGKFDKSRALSDGSMMTFKKARAAITHCALRMR
jgi:hypothetical protein